MRRLIAAILLALPVTLPAAELDKRAREIDRFVRQLGDPDAKVRDEADRQLRKIGEPALDALAKAARGNDAGVAGRARGVASGIEKTVPWEVRRFAGPTDQILCVTFDPTGKRCAAGGFDKVIRVWDVPRGRGLPPLQGHEDTGVT